VKIYIKKKKTKEVTREKCIPLGIKDDNVLPKFIVPIENATLKNHNYYKNGLKILNFNNYGTYVNKGDS